MIGFDFCAVMLPDPTRTGLLAKGRPGLSADFIAQLKSQHALVIDPAAPDRDTVVERSA